MNRLVKKMTALAVCGLLLTGLIGGVSEASAHHRQAPAPQYDQQEGPDPHREEPKPHRDEHREPQPEPPRDEHHEEHDDNDAFAAAVAGAIVGAVIAENT
jgi:hypothetical protein